MEKLIIKRLHKLLGNPKVTDAAIIEFIDMIKDILLEGEKQFKERVYDIARELSLPAELIDKVKETKLIGDDIENLTLKKAKTQIKNSCKTFLPLHEHQLGMKEVLSDEYGKVVRKNKIVKMNYVSVQETAVAILQDEKTLNEILNEKVSTQEWIKDIDARKFHRNTALLPHKDPETDEWVITMRVVLYADATETVNPIGSKKGDHEANGIYFYFQNEDRSSGEDYFYYVHTITNSKDVEEYGYNKILDPFVKELRQNREGVSLVINGIPIKLKLMLVGVTGMTRKLLLNFYQTLFFIHFCS